MPRKLYKKGQSGNPKGRPKGSTNRYSISELANCIKKVEKTKRKKFIVAWIEAAWGDAAQMSNVMNYMLPRLKSIEGAVGILGAEMEEDMAKAIQRKLRKRYGA